MSVNEALLMKMMHIGILACRAPNQGLESSFCCWTAGQGLARKEHAFHRRRYEATRSSVFLLLALVQTACTLTSTSPRSSRVETSPIGRISLRPFSYFKILERSSESLDESSISGWSIQVSNTMLRFIVRNPQSRLWNLEYESHK